MRRKHLCITGPDQLEDRKLLSLAAGAAPFPLPFNTHPAVVATATPTPGLLTGGNARVATQSYALEPVGDWLEVAQLVFQQVQDATQPSPDDILNAVNGVSQQIIDLQNNLDDWGNRISEEVQAVSQKIDARFIASQIALSNTAIQQDSREFQVTHSETAWFAANDNSYLAIQNLLQLQGPQYAGALVYAVNNRIAVLRILHEFRPDLTTNPATKAEMDGYIARLQDILNTINGSINAANTVTVSSFPLFVGGSSSSGGLYIKPIFRGTMYTASYLHNGVVQKSFSAISPSGSSAAQMAAVSQTVRSQAEAALRVGINQDRQALGVPSLGAVLMTWKIFDPQLDDPPAAMKASIAGQWLSNLGQVNFFKGTGGTFDCGLVFFPWGNFEFRDYWKGSELSMEGIEVYPKPGGSYDIASLFLSPDGQTLMGWVSGGCGIQPWYMQKY
jgi:hypothetical protein